MGKAMEDMTATASGKLKLKIGSSPAAIFTFVASLVRTNLECELVQRGGTLQAHPPPRYKSRNDCIGKYLFLIQMFPSTLFYKRASVGTHWENEAN